MPDLIRIEIGFKDPEWETARESIILNDWLYEDFELKEPHQWAAENGFNVIFGCDLYYHSHEYVWFKWRSCVWVEIENTAAATLFSLKWKGGWKYSDIPIFIDLQKRMLIECGG